MKIENTCSIAAAFLGIAAEGWYCYEAAIGDIEPKLATWLLFSVGTSLSSWLYFRNKKERCETPHFWDSPATWLDPLFTVLVFVFAAFAPRVDRTIVWSDYLCIAGAITALGVWRLSGSIWRGYITVHIVMTAGYIPMWVKLWFSKTNTESKFMWDINLLIAALFMVAPLRARDRFGTWSMIRAFTCVAIAVLIMALLHPSQSPIGPR